MELSVIMYDYRENKERYKPNELGSLYIDDSKLSTNERPIIYIGGQMEHRCHVLEQCGKTFDMGHEIFTGSWFYDYPVILRDKSKITAEAFAANFLEALNQSGLKEIDIVTESFGGLIGSYVSKDPRVHRIYAVHPPITGTPLANPDLVRQYSELYSKQERLISLLVQRIIDKRYGFEKDNAKGVDLRKVDLNKLLVIGSAVDDQEQSDLVRNLYSIIYKISGLPSDGVVIFDEELFRQKGINFVRESRPLNHFDAGSEERLHEIKEFVISPVKHQSI